MRKSAFKRIFGRLLLEPESNSKARPARLHSIKTPPKRLYFSQEGIGITPFRSIVRQAIKDKLPHRIYLFYSNRRPEDAAFLRELQTLSAFDPHFIFCADNGRYRKFQAS